METPKEESAENKQQFYRELFKEALYVVNEPAPPPITKPAPAPPDSKTEPRKPSLPFSGDRNSSLLILYSYPHAIIPSADEAMLRKLVSAIGHDYDAACKLNMAESIALEEVLEQSPAAGIISFGIPGVSGKYKMNEVAAIDNRQIIVTYTVTELETTVDLKKALWQKLQEVFKK